MKSAVLSIKASAVVTMLVSHKYRLLISIQGWKN
nr:hypothetical protein SHINE37_120265 [Rhizobiaceae bacterium]